jgi:hypothetical protein
VAVVRSDSRIKTVDDLRQLLARGQGQVLLVDPLSVSGALAPRVALVAERVPLAESRIRVVAAGDPHAPSAQEALLALCRTYWFPLYTTNRRRGYEPDVAQDLTQELFTRLPGKGVLAEADPARGRSCFFSRR